MTAPRLVAVILAGGAGTRFWPLSREARPKPLLRAGGRDTLLAETVARARRFAARRDVWLVCGAEHATAMRRASGLAADRVLVEPCARNTAPAIALAAARIAAEDPAAVLVVLSADHRIPDGRAFAASVRRAVPAAGTGALVTIGIRPTRAETGLGYIRLGRPAGREFPGLHRVARFVEKPDHASAEKMLAAGGYYWNSGMFMLGARSFLSEAEALSPESHEAARGAVESAKADLDFIRLDESSFAAAPNISVDYAIFEKSHLVSLIPVSFPWSDLGSWDAVWKVSGKDAAGNVVKGDATLNNTQNSLVVSEKAHVAIDGLDDIAVIASEDAIYIGKLSDAQRVGPMVKVLKANPATLGITEIHRTAYRPWGGYSSILSGDRFQVKRLFVKPGKRLSLQKHHHRSEHWVVVRGTAEVTLDGKVSMLSENESIYLPLGCTHRLANPGKILLELIEVQTGSYLGEDDIIRIEDEFGRK